MLKTLTAFSRMTEFFEIFDEQNQPLYFTKARHEVHRDGDWHRTIQVFVVNEREQVLCNLRSRDKDVYPAFWDISVGGHMAPGEHSLQAAVRELFEELGICLQPQELRFVTHFSLDGFDDSTCHTDREHATIFLYKTHLTASDFRIAADEIDALEFFSIDFIKQSLKADIPVIRFVPLKTQYPELLGKVADFLTQNE